LHKSVAQRCWVHVSQLFQHVCTVCSCVSIWIQYRFVNTIVRTGDSVYVLLCGGTKRGQHRDIAKAQAIARSLMEI